MVLAREKQILRVWGYIARSEIPKHPQFLVARTHFKERKKEKIA